MAFDPIPILKTDSAKEKAIKRRMNKTRLAKYNGSHGKSKKRDTTQADGESRNK